MSGFAYYKVSDNNEVIGFISKSKQGRGEIAPWQAERARLVPGRPAQVGKLIGSFYEEDGGKKAALLALQKVR